MKLSRRARVGKLSRTAKRSFFVLLLALSASVSTTGCVWVHRDHDRDWHGDHEGGWDHDHHDYDHHD